MNSHNSRCASDDSLSIFDNKPKFNVNDLSKLDLNLTRPTAQSNRNNSGSAQNLSVSHHSSSKSNHSGNHHQNSTHGPNGAQASFDKNFQPLNSHSQPGYLPGPGPDPSNFYPEFIPNGFLNSNSTPSQNFSNTAPHIFPSQNFNNFYSQHKPKNSTYLPNFVRRNSLSSEIPRSKNFTRVFSGHFNSTGNTSHLSTLELLNNKNSTPYQQEITIWLKRHWGVIPFFEKF